jgi:hypothetical protein
MTDQVDIEKLIEEGIEKKVVLQYLHSLHSIYFNLIIKTIYFNLKI